MSRKAAAGAGTIRKVNRQLTGKSYTYWEARVTVGRDPGTGKQKQRSFYGKTQAEVRRKVQEAALAVDNGTYKDPCSLTVAEWLSIWESEYLARVKYTTKLNYSQHIKNHLVPAFGSVRLQELSTPMIQRFYNSLTISPKTIKNVHGVLHRALQQAVKIGYLTYNPSDACELPRVEKKEISPLDADAMARFLEAIHGHRYEALYTTMLFTGIRRGEACGLLWKKVDLQKGTILIDRQLQNIPGRPGEYHLMPTKNSKGRVISIAGSVIKLLRSHYARQAEMRLRAGSMWNDTGYVFTNELGEHLSPSTVYHDYKKIMASIGLPDARLHDLRHSYAVASIQAGDDIKTVQHNLGHHTAAFTLDVYGHVTEQMRQASAERMDDFIKSISSW